MNNTFTNTGSACCESLFDSPYDRQNNNAWDGVKGYLDGEVIYSLLIAYYGNRFSAKPVVNES
jgi:hypothetical protein